MRYLSYDVVIPVILELFDLQLLDFGGWIENGKCILMFIFLKMFFVTWISVNFSSLAITKNVA